MDYKSCEIFNIFSLIKKLYGLNKQRIESFGLNNLESMILFHIDKLDGPTQKDLVNKLQIPKQTVNSIILHLKEDGLVYMEASNEDKRVKSLFLTNKGVEKVKVINHSLSFSDEEIYDKLGDQKIKEIDEDLNQIIEIMENIIKEVI